MHTIKFIPETYCNAFLLRDRVIELAVSVIATIFNCVAAKLHHLKLLNVKFKV